MKRFNRGDVLRYAAGGRPDAKVIEVAANGVQVEYSHPWAHPGINRPVVGQFVSRDEQSEWRKAA